MKFKEFKQIVNDSELNDDDELTLIIHKRKMFIRLLDPDDSIVNSKFDFCIVKMKDMTKDGLIENRLIFLVDK